MKKRVNLFIILTVTIVFSVSILIPLGKKYLTDEGRISSFILNGLDIVIPPDVKENLEKGELGLIKIDKINGYKIYEARSLNSMFRNDGLTTFCIDNRMISHSGKIKIKATKYSAFNIYGIKNYQVYSIEFLLKHRLIDIEAFFSSLKEYDMRNDTNFYRETCY